MDFTLLWISRKYLFPSLNSFVDLQKADAKTYTRRQNSQMNFHPLSNAEIKIYTDLVGEIQANLITKLSLGIPKYIKVNKFEENSAVCHIFYPC